MGLLWLRGAAPFVNEDSLNAKAGRLLSHGRDKIIRQPPEHLAGYVGRDDLP
jgi:hypothetical protein